MKALEISSKENPTYRKLKRLLTSKGIKEDRCFFLMGEKLIHEFLKTQHPRFKIKNVVTFDGQDLPVLDTRIVLKKDLFNEIDILGTHYPLLILEYRDLHDFDFNGKAEGLEIISPIGDPKNFGALARSAVAFGASKIILTHDSCHPFLPYAVKSSAGAVLQLDIFISRLKLNEIPLLGQNLALDLEGQPITTVTWPRDMRLFIGEEGPGLQLSIEQARRMSYVSIPTSSVESLNATVSASIALWERRRQLTSLNS